MTKIDLGRIFEVSKLLQTKSGQETQEGWEWLSDFGERTIRALQNGVGFSDNVDCKVDDFDLPHNTDQIVNTNGRTPIHIIATRVVASDTTITIRDFGWRINDDSEIVVNCGYGNSTDTQSVRLIIIFS